MYAYIHPSCGKPAWLMVDKPKPGQLFLSAPLLDLTHSPKSLASGCTCESCGGSMFGMAGDMGNVVNYIQWKADKSA